MSRLSDVNAFIELSRGCADADDLRRLMEGITFEMGFCAYALFRHHRHIRLDDKNLLALSNFPRAWIEYFFQHKLHLDDPVHVASYRTLVGFRFSDIPSLVALTDRQRHTLELARKEGIGDGFCVPAHLPDEIPGSCTFVVREAGGLPEANLPMAQLVGSFAYEAARRIQSAAQRCETADSPSPAAAQPAMTTRQLECLALVARGKSDWEIARILGIGQETVKHHIRAVRERYDVGTRIQAAIRAISDGDLNIRDVLS